MRRLNLLLTLLLLAGCSALPRPPAATPIAVQGGEFDPSSVPTLVVIPTVTPGLAPVASLERLEGGETTLDAWRGKAVILNFWATWCWPCRQEMPALQALQDGNEDVVVVGVNFEESAEKAQGFVEELGLSFPIVLDPDGTFGAELDVVGLPTTFFIDAEGRIVGSHVGQLDEAELQEAMEMLRAP
jgi:DsbE subfamily thiol:disulfide oxidoreductase